MADDIRIKDLQSTASSMESDDYLPIDSLALGNRKIPFTGLMDSEDDRLPTTAKSIRGALGEHEEDISGINSSLSANYVFGNQVNIISYSSSSNMFKAPSDGYILVQTWNNDSPINLWIGANSLSIPITNTTLKAFALFAKKGTSYWIGRTGTNNSAMFLPLVMEQ